MKKVFLIDRLIAENWFDSEKEALPFIMAGRVLADDRQVLSGKEKISAGSVIRVKEYYKKKYVSKGGLKLEKALAYFCADAGGIVALDCGAAAGGFTDCLLRHGARLVYAVDAGHGELAAKLVNDARVVCMERTNISDGILSGLDPAPELITLDLSYLSLKTGVSECKKIMQSGKIIALIKPIVEVGSSEIKRSGDINRREIIEGVLADLCGFFISSGFDILGLTHSPVRGNRDAAEYFVYLQFGEAAAQNINLTYTDYFEKIIGESFALAKFDKNNFGGP